MKLEEFKFYKEQLDRFVLENSNAYFKELDIEIISSKVADSWESNEYSLINLPYKFGDVNTYNKFQVSIKLDKELLGKKVFLKNDLGFVDRGFTVGSETLMYLNGEPVMAVDKYHNIYGFEISGDTLELEFHNWSGIANEHMLKSFYGYEKNRNRNELFEFAKPLILERNELKYEVITYLDVLLETLNVMKDNINYHYLLRSTYKFYCAINGDINSINLENQFAELKNNVSKCKVDHRMSVSVLGQSHIDLAWLWRVKHTREKISRTFSTQMKLLEDNPDYIYFQSQPILFKYLEEDYPVINQKLEKFIEQGRVEVDGAMWLEPDTNLLSGESLTRQLYFGKKYMKEKYNRDSKILWLLDVFGYSSQLPQILTKSGVDTFVTTKMQWNETNRMPHHTFNWIGIDGTPIFTHLIENIDYVTINTESLMSGLNNYTESSSINKIIYPYGHGDGGGGPEQEDITKINLINEMGLLPKLEHRTMEQHFNLIKKELDEFDMKNFPSWDGELYLEIHRGTYTSQAKIKQAIRKIESRLKFLELYSVVACKAGYKTFKEEIDAVWEEFLLIHFHDIAPGSTIKDAVVDALELVDTLIENIEQIKKNIFDQFVTRNDSYLFNFATKECSYLYETNKNYDFEYMDKGFKFAKNLKPLSFTKITNNNFENEESNLVGKHKYRSMEFDIDETGKISNVINVHSGKVIFGDDFDLLKCYHDKPLKWNAWDTNSYYKDCGYNLLETSNPKKIFENSELFTFSREYTYNDSKINQLVVIYKNEGKIEFKNNVNWYESEKLLRVEFAHNINSKELICDIPYGNVSRKFCKNTPWDSAKFEVCAQRYVAIEDNRSGFALFNDSKYGFDLEDNNLGMSLIKTGIDPDPTQDIGKHEFSYMIYLYNDSFINSGVEAIATMYNSYQLPIEYEMGVEPIISGIPESVAIDAIKVHNETNAIITRVHDWCNVEVKIENIECEYDLLENKIKVSDELKNFEIKTITLK